jgi:hypothetical protein
MAEQSIASYRFSEFRVVPLTSDSALLAHLADIQAPDKAQHHMSVGEVWRNHNGQWRIHANSGARMK